jgi:carboxyl-terminal processing protease
VQEVELSPVIPVTKARRQKESIGARILFSVRAILAISLVVAVMASASTPARSQESRLGGPGSDNRSASLTRARDLAFQHQGRAYPKDATRLFSTIIEMIDSHYAGNFVEKREFDRTLEELAMMTLPHCTERVTPLAGCDDEPARCFLEAIHSVSACSNRKMKQVLIRAMKILLRNLDPNSALMDANMVKELRISTSGKFGGVGMVVGVKQGDYVVVSALDGSPAFKAGIKPGDKVLAIDGEPIHGLPLLEVLSKVRGPSGSRIRLTIGSRDKGVTRQVTLRRQVIRIPPVRYERLDGNVGYLRIINFQTGTAKAARRALRRLFRDTPGGLKGLILDLRSNPGGLFDEAIKVADLLLSSKTITVVKGRLQGINREFKAKRSHTFPQVPTVVLINRGTASGSEILTGALRQRPDVVVMGEHSFGKASVQGVFLLGEGRALRLTTAHYYTPEGLDIDGKGIKPDIEVQDPDDRSDRVEPRGLGDSDLRHDPVVAKALKYIATGRSHAKSPFPTLF